MYDDEFRHRMTPGGVGYAHILPSIPGQPYGRGVVRGNCSPDVSGGRHSFPSPVLWQLSRLSYGNRKNHIGRISNLRGDIMKNRTTGGWQTKQRLTLLPVLVKIVSAIMVINHSYGRGLF